MSLKAKNAFTLLELLLTIMLLGICLVSVIRGLLTNARAIQMAQEYTGAISAADQVMFELLQTQASARIPLEGELNNQAGYRYRLYLQDPADHRRQLPLKEVRLEIRWQAGHRDQGISFSTYLIEPVPKS